jgi:hypothetical protein
MEKPNLDEMVAHQCDRYGQRASGNPIKKHARCLGVQMAVEE